MSTNEIDALLNLIDDPDEAVYMQIRERLVSYGEDVIPRLENIWEINSFGHEYQQRIEDIIHEIQFESVYKALDIWAREGGQDLFEGALMVARYQYPDMDEMEVRSDLDRIRQDVWLELNDDLTALEQVKVMNHILFEVHGLRGNKKNFHAAQNSYINTVLESKKGNPLSLSIVYMVIAQKLEIPIYGVNLPNHFLLGYADEHQIMKLFGGIDEASPGENEMLFYINAFSRGAIVHKSEIDDFLRHLELSGHPNHYSACTNIVIVTRLLNNLIFSYDRLGYPEKVKELRKLHEAVARYAIPPEDEDE
jgi:hypothetical protein